MAMTKTLWILLLLAIAGLATAGTLVGLNVQTWQNDFNSKDPYLWGGVSAGAVGIIALVLFLYYFFKG